MRLPALISCLAAGLALTCPSVAASAQSISPVELSIAAPDNETLAASWWPGAPDGPGLVLLGVAGPTDRNLGFGGHAPFASLAEALSQAGIHVLSFDDPGTGGSSGDWTRHDFPSMARNAGAAAEMLASTADIPLHRIGFYGLSEGSGIALHVAASGAGNFLILGSPPGISGETALRERMTGMLEASNADPATIDAYLAAFDQFTALCRAGDTDRLAAFLAGPGAALVPRYAFVPRDPEGQARLFASTWHVGQLDFDPAPLLPQVSEPVLIVGGALDPVLAPDIHHPPLQAGLENSTTIVFEDANHLLMPARTGSPLEYAMLEHDLHPDLVPAILDWLETQEICGRGSGAAGRCLEEGQ